MQKPNVVMMTEKYAKTILSKVSFDQKLFRKELRKVLDWLDEKDRAAVKKWVKKNYQTEYVKL